MLLGVNCPMERKQRCFDVNAIGLLNTYVNAIFDTLGQAGRLFLYVEKCVPTDTRFISCVSFLPSKLFNKSFYNTGYCIANNIGVGYVCCF